MIEFRSSILAGVILVRSAIQSPDYVAGISGWTINQDGSAEFNNITVRGTLYVTSSSGAFIHIYVNGANDPVIDLQPAPMGVHTITPGRVYSLSFPGGTDRVGTHIESPALDGFTSSTLDLYSDETGHRLASLIADELILSSVNTPIDIVSDGVTMQQWDGGQVTAAMLAGDAVRVFNNLITFNYPFVSPPAVVLTVNTGNGNFSRWTARVFGVTNTTASVIVEKGAAADGNMAANTNAPINWVAIGS